MKKILFLLFALPLLFSCSRSLDFDVMSPSSAAKLTRSLPVKVTKPVIVSNPDLVGVDLRVNITLPQSLVTPKSDFRIDIEDVSAYPTVFKYSNPETSYSAALHATAFPSVKCYAGNSSSGMAETFMDVSLPRSFISAGEGSLQISYILYVYGAGKANYTYGIHQKQVIPLSDLRGALVPVGSCNYICNIGICPIAGEITFNPSVVDWD